MISGDFLFLVITTVSVALIHVILGPDHYVPFVVLSRSEKWPWRKTFIVVFASAVFHLASSVILGFLGIFTGLGISKVLLIDQGRGQWATAILITFGLLYFIWGLRRAFGKSDKVNTTVSPWILTTVLVLGPCEPLIPLMMYTSMAGSLFQTVCVVLIFSLTTILFMVSLALALSFKLSGAYSQRLERFSPALSGAMIFISAVAVFLYS